MYLKYLKYSQYQNKVFFYFKLIIKHSFINLIANYHLCTIRNYLFISLKEFKIN